MHTQTIYTSKQCLKQLNGKPKSRKLLDEEAAMAWSLADELAVGDRTKAVRTRLGELESEKSAIERKPETGTRTEKMQGQANDLSVVVQSFAQDISSCESG